MPVALRRMDGEEGSYDEGSRFDFSGYPPSPSPPSSRRRYFYRRRRRRRKRPRRPETYDDSDDGGGDGTRKEYLDYRDFDDFEDFGGGGGGGGGFDPALYDDKNYHYVDQDEVERIKAYMAATRKPAPGDGHTYGGGGDMDLPDYKVDFDFRPVDYRDYEYADVGLLDFSKPAPPPQPPQPQPPPPSPPRGLRPADVYASNRLRKRRYRRPGGTRVYVMRRRRPLRYVDLGSVKRRAGTSPFLEGLGSNFDFGSMATLLGLWYLWQQYLVSECTVHCPLRTGHWAPRTVQE